MLIDIGRKVAKRDYLSCQIMFILSLEITHTGLRDFWDDLFAARARHALVPECW